MLTNVVPASDDGIQQAAAILRAGGLVAFPTETVYGLGANARDDRAVAGVFAAKGRPSGNPLIVHVADAVDAMAYAGSWPEAAQRLAARFWPGPLTLVVPTSPRISSLATAGGTTVALRVPAHPVAQALLRATALPIAAPSANRSSSLSPTRAEHVLASLDTRIPLILDGGPSPGGLESTVLDVSVTPPRLLRPGLVTPARIEEVIGPIEVHPPAAEGQPLKSPGLLSRHYAPRTPLLLATGDGWRVVQDYVAQGLRVGWLTFGEPPQLADPAQVVTLALPVDPAAYAAELYAALHILDAAGVDAIIVATPPLGDGWLAVHDRLERASAKVGPMGGAR